MKELTTEHLLAVLEYWESGDDPIRWDHRATIAPTLARDLCAARAAWAAVTAERNAMQRARAKEAQEGRK